jgi:bacterioferritin
VQGNPEIIEVLNEVLTAELTAINQYFIHAKMCENWGLDRLAEKVRDESIDEMKDADRVIERLNSVRVGETVPEQFELDLDLERAAVERYNRAVKLARDAGDNGTAELLEDLLVGEEHHADWLEAQLHLIRAVGLENYLAQQIRG